jgi:hypothetical protein
MHPLPVSDFELRISNFRFGKGVYQRLREKHFRNDKAGKDLRSENSSHGSFTLRRIRQAHRWRDGGVGGGAAA